MTIPLALGEFRNFHYSTVSRTAWISLVYLIVAGSITAFTAKARVPKDLSFVDHLQVIGSMCRLRKKIVPF